MERGDGGTDGYIRCHFLEVAGGGDDLPTAALQRLGDKGGDLHRRRDGQSERQGLRAPGQHRGEEEAAGAESAAASGGGTSDCKGGWRRGETRRGGELGELMFL